MEDNLNIREIDIALNDLLNVGLIKAIFEDGEIKYGLAPEFKDKTPEELMKIYHKIIKNNG